MIPRKLIAALPTFKLRVIGTYSECLVSLEGKVQEEGEGLGSGVLELVENGEEEDAEGDDEVHEGEEIDLLTILFFLLIGKGEGYLDWVWVGLTGGGGVGGNE